MNVSLVIVSAIFARKKTTLEEGAFTAPGGNVVSVITVALILCTYLPKLFGSGNGQMWIFSIVLYAIGALIMVYYSRKNAAAK